MSLHLVKASRRGRQKRSSTLQEVIALSRRCSAAYDSGALDVCFRVMAERDELCKELTSQERRAYLAWARGQFTDEQWREFGEALGGIVEMCTDMTDYLQQQR